MKFHFYTRYIEVYFCTSRIWDIRNDEFYQPIKSIRLGRYVLNSKSGFRNIRKEMWQAKLGGA